MCIEFVHFGGDFEVRFLHIAAVKCNQIWTGDRVRYQEEDAQMNQPVKELIRYDVKSQIYFDLSDLTLGHWLKSD